VTPALQHDRAVPQRDLLLDTEHVAARLSTLLGTRGPLPIDECKQTRVKYRIGVRLRVVHRIRSRGVRYNVAASTFPTLERSERAYLQGLARAVPSEPLLPVAHDIELRTVFWTFPNDRKIVQLPALTAPHRGLADLLAPAWAESLLVAYAPEKAATVRCLDGAGRTFAYAKAYAGEDGERIHRVHEALADALPADDPYLRVPRPLGYSREHRTLLVAAIEGLPLLALADRDVALGYRRLGRALARLHGLGAPDVARFRRVDPDRLEAAAELIASVRSDVAHSVRTLARDICRRVDHDGERVCLHGDVNFRNALLEDGRLALIDLDQVAVGPAAADLGSVLATLRYAGIVGLVPATDVPDLEGAFLAGYSELRPPPDSAALGWHTAAALLAERALRVVTRIRPHGLVRLPPLLAESRRALG
jgi:tRNA A-37 threonylcarbamoyl transferase component Bud32